MPDPRHPVGKAKALRKQVLVCAAFLALLLVVASTAERVHMLLPFVARFFGFELVGVDVASSNPTELSLNVWGQDETIALGQQAIPT
eukprot:scaffold712_cov404-Prasinococcus_capsulatus_cf.AAC.17